MPDNDKVRELHDRLLSQVESLVNSEDWRRFLTVAARFHRYSASNTLLIMLQAPDATRVCGYRSWQSLGRQVRKGERGIAIFAPCVYRRRPVDDDEAARTPELARVLRGFRIAYIWDVSQTDGDPLPEVAPKLLAGEAPPGLWESLAREVANAGYELRRGQCGGANGRTSYTTRTVTVRDDVDDAMATRTLMHELAHIWLHDPEEALHHRGTAEIEAESTAYVVCQAAGMVTDDYSLPYVARWSGGDPAAVRLTAERVIGAARRALEAVGIVQDAEVAEAVPA